MTTVDSYIEYTKLLTGQYQPQLRYRGEAVMKGLQTYLPNESVIWIIWDKKDGLECCQVVKMAGFCSIPMVIDIVNLFEYSGIRQDVLFCSEVQSWLNLCHSEDDCGVVYYDSYYDRYPVCDHGRTLGEVRMTLRTLITAHLPFQKGDIVVLDGNLRQSNLMKNLLQSLGCRIFLDNIDDTSVKQDDSLCESAAHINLFIVGIDSTIIVPMPLDRDLAVYDVSTLYTASAQVPKMKILKSSSDFFGNIWLSTLCEDGSSNCCLHKAGEVNYSEIKFK